MKKTLAVLSLSLLAVMPSARADVIVTDGAVVVQDAGSASQDHDHDRDDRRHDIQTTSEASDITVIKPDGDIENSGAQGDANDRDDHNDLGRGDHIMIVD